MALISTIALAASRNGPLVGSTATAGSVKRSGPDGATGELFWNRLMYQLQQPQPCAAVEQPRAASGPATLTAGDGSGALDAITAQLDLARRLRSPAPNSAGY